MLQTSEAYPLHYVGLVIQALAPRVHVDKYVEQSLDFVLLGLNAHVLATQTGLAASVTKSQLHFDESVRIVPSHYTESVKLEQEEPLLTQPCPLIPRVHDDNSAEQVASVIADAVLSVQVNALHAGVVGTVSQKQ